MSIITTATATEMQNNFGRYLNLVLSGQEIIVTKNGKEVGRFIPKDSAISYLTDSLTGILKGDYDLDKEKAERLKEKYEITDWRKCDSGCPAEPWASRKGFIHHLEAVWTRQAEGFISALTFANLVYVMRKELNPEQTEEVLQKLSLIFTFTELSPSDLTSAAHLKWDDFEDALQSVTAERIHVDYIVTRNIRDFLKSKVVAFTPSELFGRM